MHYNRILLFCIVFLLFTSCKEKKPPVQTDYSLKLPHPSQTLTLLFCGDIIQHLPQIYSAHEPSEKDYKYQKCFKYIAPYWADADFVIANLETTDGSTAIVKELYENKKISSDQRDILSTYLFTGTAIIGMMVSYGIWFLPQLKFGQGAVFLVVIVMKFVSGNMMRFYLKFANKNKVSGEVE